MRTRSTVIALVTAAALSGCTMVNTARLPSDRSGRDIFLTSGDIPEAYTTLGVVQATRGGVRLFGFFDPAGTNIEKGLGEVLIPEIKKMGGDGAINVRFHQTQYTPWVEGVFMVLFFLPLPTEVVVSGEVVKLRR
jgi:hypothetical protein